ncbi:MAG: sensor histidine kinase [Terriglobales bacterium]
MTRKCVWVSLIIAGVVALLHLARPQANLTTIALLLTVAVTICAVKWGSLPGLLAALWGGLCFNYFFIPPVHTWSISDPQNWIAFAAFMATAFIVGQLSSRALRQAEAAEVRRVEIERLYEQLKQAFEKASQAESLRRSEKLKTALLDTVTHDLRTPLTSIKASVTTLLGPSPNGGAPALPEDAHRELLEVINEESDRLNRFVEHMMELAQLEAGHLLLHQQPTGARDIIAAALDRAAPLLASHPVEISIEDALPPLQVDAICISNLLFELLENAAKYSPSGTAIHLHALRDSGRQAQLSVEDEGRGIPAELRERVFEKFFRGASQSHNKNGFGMGLAIARGIVEAHGGRIWIETGRAGGAVVRFTVPCSPSA